MKPAGPHSGNPRDPATARSAIPEKGRFARKPIFSGNGGIHPILRKNLERHTMKTESALQTHGLTKRFGALHAVRDLNLTLPTGSLCALLGPNGCGKTKGTPS